MKRLAVLGSTGSIGTQTLDIVRQHPDKLQVTALVANRSHETLADQAAEFKCGRVALMDEAAARTAGVPGGLDAIVDLATSGEVDMVVVSVAGVIGLVPTIAAIRAGKEIALASKEVLVAAGEVVMPLIAKHKTLLTPIDSEHSAVFQCLQGYTSGQVKRLLLTASGGPFRGKSRSDLKDVTVEQALNHPTWRMGGKITIDSATLMNKGLEVIEAKWLFGLDIDQVDIVVHPQSIVHSFVEFHDTSMLAQCGWPDMRIPIQYALLYPERSANALKPWNPVSSSPLVFEEPDFDTFRGPVLARQASKAGGTMPCVMNAANEEATAVFLKGGCGFLQMADLVEETMNQHEVRPADLDSLLGADSWARETVCRLL